ncbi:MAG: ATP-binding protein [Methylophilaceae bacterium]
MSSSDILATNTEVALHARCVDLLYSHARSAIFTAAGVAAVFVALMWKVFPHSSLLFWLGSMLLVSAWRFWQISAYYRAKPSATEIKPWLIKFSIGSALAGIVWGSAGVVFMPESNSIYQAFTILMLCGISAAAATTYSSVLWAYHVFVLPILLPLIGHMLWIGDTPHIAFGGVVTLYLLLMSQRSAKIVNQTIKESIRHSLRVAELSGLNESIINHTDSGITVYSQDGQCLTMNEAAGHILNTPVSQMGKHSFRTNASWQEYGLVEVADKVLATGVPQVFESPMHTIYGWDMWVVAQLRRIEQGNQPLLLIIFNDISTRRNAETALKQAKEAAEETARVKSQFLANMSHEIRTPMNAVISMSYLSMEETSVSTLKEYLHKIHTAGVALLDIINDVLDFSKIEAGRLEIEQRPFHLHQVLHDVETITAISADAKGLSLRFHVSGNVPNDLLGDSTRLRQIFTNLVSNAIKFTARGSVEVKIEKRAQTDDMLELECSVHDTGIGLSVEQQVRLFKPFSQADNSVTRKFGGTGLGLSICKELVELMGGKIHVVSAPDKGSTFTFNVHLLVATEQALAKIAKPVAQNLTGMRVLLVEDNQVNQLVAKTLLTRAGIDVTVANDGKLAVEILALPHAFDLVLMDIQMPNMDGIEATRAIRRELKLDLPIVALTAHAIEEERQRCEDAGMNGHISKPINPQELLETIGQFYRQPA